MIETDRLALLPWCEAERAPYEAMTADPRSMVDYGAPFDRATAGERFDRHVAAFARDGFGKWALRRKSDGVFLGYCGVSPIWKDLPPAPGLEIGWRLVAAAWGFGYATEAASAALPDAFARVSAPEVIAFTAPWNRRSLAVMERLGLRRDPGRDFRLQNGEAAVVYVADRSAWTRR